MRTTVEEIRHTVHGLLQKKREVEPDEGAEAAATEELPEEPAAEEETPATRSPALHANWSLHESRGRNERDVTRRH
jgi:hypothetical protein